MQRNGPTDNDVQLKVADFGISFILEEGEEYKASLPLVDRLPLIACP